MRALRRSHVERFAGTGVTSRRMGDNTVLTGLRADGTGFPLAAALDNLPHDFSDRTGIMARLRADFGGVSFREPTAGAVYRMAEEALTNVARHAGATAVEARLHGDRPAVRVVYNGRGIRPADLDAPDSYGLPGIRERAQTLGGAARIHASTEGGAAVDIEVPIAPYQTGDDTR